MKKCDMLHERNRKNLYSFVETLKFVRIKFALKTCESFSAKLTVHDLKVTKKNIYMNWRKSSKEKKVSASLWDYAAIQNLKDCHVLMLTFLSAMTHWNLLSL